LPPRRPAGSSAAEDEEPPEEEFERGTSRRQPSAGLVSHRPRASLRAGPRCLPGGPRARDGDVGRGRRGELKRVGRRICASSPAANPPGRSVPTVGLRTGPAGDSRRRARGFPRFELDWPPISGAGSRRRIVGGALLTSSSDGRSRNRDQHGARVGGRGGRRGLRAETLPGVVRDDGVRTAAETRYRALGW